MENQYIYDNLISPQNRNISECIPDTNGSLDFSALSKKKGGRKKKNLKAHSSKKMCQFIKLWNV